MSLLLLLSVAALPPPPPLTAVPAALPLATQEPPPEEGEEREEVEQDPPPKKDFDKLSSAKRKKARNALTALKGGRTEEARAAAVETLRELGEGAVPLLLDAWPDLAEAERMDALYGLLDALLAEDALHLAWRQVAEDAPSAARAWVVTRWDGSARKDVVEFLAARISDPAPEVAYAAARGLLKRDDARGWDVVAAWVAEHWTEQADSLRADFAGLPRGPMAGRAAAALNATKRKARLAGLHLFELFGVVENAALLLPALSESDTTLRLAAIDAARAVVDGDAALERPSMTGIIERAEAWKKRIATLQRERKEGNR
jgi:hypothetical protein